MSEKQLKELQEYNLEYLEAQQSEEIFGGDYTSAVELKYAKQEIERLNNIINEALRIANERYNYYFNKKDKELLEDWEEIFDVLLIRDNPELKGDK